MIGLKGVKTWEPAVRKRDNFAELEASIRGLRCLSCDGIPRLVTNPDGPEAFRLRCECKRGPQLGAEVGKVRRRIAKMTEAAMEIRPADKVLTLDEIKRFVARDATPDQAGLFLEFCKGHHLNPFMGEAYLIIRGGKPTIQIGIGAILKKASRHPAYDGYESGIIVDTKDGGVEEREGTFFITATETLLGGWAIVHRKDQSRPRPSKLRLEERIQKKDGKPSSTWASMPGGQIEKCAIAEAHRRAFPDVIGPLFDQPEVRVEMVEDSVVGEAEALAAPPEAAQEPTAAPAEARVAQDAPNPIDDLFPAKEEVAARNAPDDGRTLSAPDGQRTFATGGEFFTACRRRWPETTSYDVATVMGVKEPTKITDYAAAWAKLVEAWK
jgi:phage recombination protein Bet